MKKNGQYVGVDEKFVPEEEKYVDNTLNEEIKSTINEGVKSVKDYVSDEENKKKIKKGVKGIGIGYLILKIIPIIIAICLVICFLVSFIKMSSTMFSVTDTAGNFFKEVFEKFPDVKSEVSSQKASNYNRDLEIYQGTQKGMQVISLLDEVVTKIKKDSEHSLTLVMDGVSYINASDIILLKQKVDDWSDYEIEFDYDPKGYINKVTITTY